MGCGQRPPKKIGGLCSKFVDAPKPPQSKPPQPKPPTPKPPQPKPPAPTPPKPTPPNPIQTEPEPIQFEPKPCKKEPDPCKAKYNGKGLCDGKQNGTNWLVPCTECKQYVYCYDGCFKRKCERGLVFDTGGSDNVCKALDAWPYPVCTQ